MIYYYLGKRTTERVEGKNNYTSFAFNSMTFVGTKCNSKTIWLKTNELEYVIQKIISFYPTSNC